MAISAINETDAGLLRQFVQDRSEAALRCLTERHLDMVFGTAVRRTSDRGAAEEIAQNVFIALVRKAAWLQHESSLAAWLHQTTVLEARQWWRGETRRRQREQIAVKLETTMKTSEEISPAMSGVLDEALLDLREGDRQAVLLRFFEGRNHREIGAALGIGEDAARKRLDKAMDRLTVFFRRRGFAVGSAMLLTILTGAAKGAPAGLAATVVQAAWPSSGALTAPLLVKILGLGRGQLAGICVATLLIPAAWQEARLVSARAEQRRMEALLALVQSEHAAMLDDLLKVRRQTDSILAGGGRTDSAALAGGSNASDAQIFRWDAKADYVRVPKELLKRVGFGGNPLNHDVQKTLDAGRATVSSAALGILGLNAQEQARVQDFFSQNIKAYRDWAESNSYLTEFHKIEPARLNLPNGMASAQVMKLNDDTRVWVTPSISDDGGAWRAQFEAGLASSMGDERAKLLLNAASGDGSLGECLRQFGTKGSFMVVTPDAEGGFWLSQNAKDGNNWAFNTPGSFSSVLESAAAEPFDDKAARQQIEQRIQQRRSQYPDEVIPSIEDIMDQARKSWLIEQEIKHPNVVQLVLGRPLPQSMVDYLSQWRAAHPDAPDSFSTKKTP